MSLYIDLLREEERSNPGEKILNTTLITAAVVVLIGLGLYVAQNFLMMGASHAALQRAQSRSDEMRQNHGVALKLIADIADARATLTELAAFSNAQIQVSVSNETFKTASLLEALAWSVPPDVQLTRLKVFDTLVAGGPRKDLPARRHAGEIAGRTSGDGVEERIRAVISALNEAGGVFGAISAGGISVDTAKPTERLFEIRFTREPRVFRLDAPEGRAK